MTTTTIAAAAVVVSTVEGTNEGCEWDVFSSPSAAVAVDLLSSLSIVFFCNIRAMRRLLFRALCCCAVVASSIQQHQQRKGENKKEKTIAN